MKDIFITATFRNEWNQEFNLRLAKALEQKGYTTFVPQRDSEQIGNRKETFLQDVAGIDQSRMILAVGTKTQTANWGFEIGYAYKSSKPVVVITDKDHPVELMPEGATKKIFITETIDEIDTYLEDIIAAIKDFLK